MQIDGEVATLIGILSSLGSTAIGYGIVREKVRRLEKDVEDQARDFKDQVDCVLRDQKEFVTYGHLDAVVEPIKDTLNVVQKDVKEILRAVSSKTRSSN